ncbi:rCG61653 [Rattus norvegicus]|uniref:RCG61653 n=1 Tax=Rattus norvegicus TaxID=10116 RepID=A6HCI6_RAT|nr:rCG61653 [Rattus norvegicus]
MLNWGSRRPSQKQHIGCDHKPPWLWSLGLPYVPHDLSDLSEVHDGRLCPHPYLPCSFPCLLTSLWPAPLLLLTPLLSCALRLLLLFEFSLYCSTLSSTSSPSLCRCVGTIRPEGKAM